MGSREVRMMVDEVEIVRGGGGQTHVEYVHPALIPSFFSLVRCRCRYDRYVYPEQLQQASNDRWIQGYRIAMNFFRDEVSAIDTVDRECVWGVRNDDDDRVLIGCVESRIRSQSVTCDYLDEDELVFFNGW